LNRTDVVGDMTIRGKDVGQAVQVEVEEEAGKRQRELRRLGMQDIDLSTYLPTLDYKSLDDLYAAVGTGDLSTARIITRISESEKLDDPRLINWE